MKRVLLGLAMAATALLAAPAAAQNQTDTDQLTATAVVAGSINVTTQTQLNFGTVMPNFGRTIVFTDAGAGHFLVEGALNAEVTLSFPSLPTDLDDGGGNLLPVTFTARHNTLADPTGGTTFDPAVGEPGTNLDAATGELHVYVGGTVTAAGTQPAGTYTALVQLTAAYTGN